MYSSWILPFIIRKPLVIVFYSTVLFNPLKPLRHFRSFFVACCHISTEYQNGNRLAELHACLMCLCIRYNRLILTWPALLVHSFVWYYSFWVSHILPVFVWVSSRVLQFPLALQKTQVDWLQTESLSAWYPASIPSQQTHPASIPTSHPVFPG